MGTAASLPLKRENLPIVTEVRFVVSVCGFDFVFLFFFYNLRIILFICRF